MIFFIYIVLAGTYLTNIVIISHFVLDYIHIIVL
jgi:hypothetical protein